MIRLKPENSNLRKYFILFLSAVSLLINCHIRHNLELFFNQEPIQQLNISKTTTRTISIAETENCQELTKTNDHSTKIVFAKVSFVPANLFSPCLFEQFDSAKVVSEKLKNSQFVPTENKRYLYFRQLKIAVPAVIV